MKHVEQVHAATPTVAHADSLGRTFLTVSHNKSKYSDTPGAAPPVEEFHATRIFLDIESNQREVIDAKGRVVMRYRYDMLGNRVHQASMEAGERWMLNDVAGKPLYAWDSRDHRFRTAYDPLRRPTDSSLSEGGGFEMLVGRSIYGESQPNPEASNLRGKVVELHDQAGVVTSDNYDFKGNLLESRRRLAEDYKATLDWSGAVLLDPETYTSRTRYDALNRPTQLIVPHSDQPGTTVNVIQPGYNDADLVERMDAWLNRNAEPGNLLDPASANLHAVTEIDYDAKGQRMLVDYGNGVRTTSTYDPLTFRLTHLLTRRNAAAFPGDCPEPSQAGWPGCQVQNLHYTYDPAGNITHIRDDAQQTIYFKNKRVEPSAEYIYDAIYRLIEATSREHLGQVGGAAIRHSYNDARRVNIHSPGQGNGFHLHDGHAMGRYCECYQYDSDGNIMEMIHRVACPGTVSWRRIYTYIETSQLEAAKDSNRLSSTQVGNAIGSALEQYTYDTHGNMLRMPHLQAMHWDFKDQLQMTQRQAVNAEDADGMQHHGERTWYVYDSSGQRVRKVTELATSQVKDERIYLGGFEIYRGKGVNPLVRETLHIMDDKQRVVLVETRTRGNEPGVPQELIRYQFGNHLGSASLELDDKARIISYEEYTPYGSTSYQAVRSQTQTPKHYRYTGMERDEESGLNYHTTRYYAAWLGRWASTDPVDMADGTNLYHYASGNPVGLVDPNGEQPNPPVPVPGQTPFNFVSESPALGNWQRASNEVLESRFRGGSLEENLRRFEQHVQGLPEGTGRGTQRHFARSVFNKVRSNFYRLEAKNPSFSYGPTELRRLRQGSAPRPGFQIHHMEHLAQRPTQAVRAGNLVFTEAGPSGGLTPGSGHHHLHHGPGARRLTQLQQAPTSRKPAAAPVAPTTSSGPRPSTSLTRPIGRPPAGRVAVPRGGGGGGHPTLVILQLFEPAIRDFIYGGLRLDPEARLRQGDVFQITREDVAAAERQRAEREMELVVRWSAHRHGISEAQAREDLERSFRSAPAYPTIGPDPGTGVPMERILREAESVSGTSVWDRVRSWFR